MKITATSSKTCLHAVYVGFALCVLAGFGGVRPYEFEWANRTADDRQVLLPLESADGWMASWTDATGRVVTVTEHPLFGKGTMRVDYRATGKHPSVHLRLAKPVPVAAGFDTVSVWVWGNGLSKASVRSNPDITAEFVDAEGKAFSVTICNVNHTDWHLWQKRLSKEQIGRVKKGGAFTGFTIGGWKNDGESWIELTSFAAYREELRPLSFRPRPKIGVRVFPNAPEGMNSGEGRLPFPTVEMTIVPVVEEDPGIEFRIPDDPLRWDDLAVRYRKGAWIRFAKGGGLSPYAAAKGAKVRFRRIANSLVADIEAPAGVEEVLFGGMADAKGATSVPVPYYSYGSVLAGMHFRPCVISLDLGGSPFFLLASVDWTQSNASEVFPYGPWPSGLRLDGSVGSNGGVRYKAKTDGTRNPVFERFVWSFSGTFADVLPVVPNPPSPYRDATAEFQYCHMWTGWNRAGDRARFLKDRRHGIRKLCVCDHEGCMRAGEESFTFRTSPAPAKGGDKGMDDFARYMIDGLGYRYGPYNNYTDLAPVNAYWSADHVTRLPDGNLKTAWVRCYAPKPAYINEACEDILSELQRKFRFNAIYCDVHTCVTPWSRTDYDARVPGAGTFAATFYSYGELLLAQRRIIGGPVYSEGGCHFMYAGLADGSYAQDQPYHLSKNPWLVDFDLLRLHPLGNNVGMGEPNSHFYNVPAKPKDNDEWVDRYLAATVAFGHQGYFLTKNLLTGNLENEEHGYYMLLGTGRHYCKADVREIRYADARGDYLDTSAAVVSGAYRRSQVAVRYADGTFTAANGSTNDVMFVPLKCGRLELPPNGFCACAGDGSACVVSGAKWKGTGRLDISVAPDYCYIDAHGTFAETPFGGTDGRMYRLSRDGDSEEVFLRKGQSFVLPYAALAVEALNGEGKFMGAAKFRTERGMTRITPREGAVSYRVARPKGWRSPPARKAAEGYARPAGDDRPVLEGRGI